MSRGPSRKVDHWAGIDLSPLSISEDATRSALESAVAKYWGVRQGQAKDQFERGSVRDAGSRSEVTGGQHMNAVVGLLYRVASGTGLPLNEIYCRGQLELPGYFRSSKEWDFLVVHDGLLVAAAEVKGIASSFGKNLNNRIEETLGSGYDLRKAIASGLVRCTDRVWRGYLLLMGDVDASRKPRRSIQPHFRADPAFSRKSYIGRGLELCKRLRADGLYESTALLTSPPGSGKYAEPDPSLGILPFLSDLASACSRARRGPGVDL